MQPDPLNSRRYVFPRNEQDPGSTEQIWSMVEMPAAPPRPHITRRPGIPAGQLQAHRLRSDILATEYQVWVYTPPGYAAVTRPHAALLLVDGWYYTMQIPTATILDNLRAEEAITAPVAIMVDTTANRVRDLNAYPPFTAFMVQELLPWARQNYSLTRNPADSVVGGLSLGGVAAASAALQHPETFGNVLAQSGAFWNGREGECEEEWIAMAWGCVLPDARQSHALSGSISPVLAMTHSTCSVASMHRAHLGAGEEGPAVHGEVRQCGPRQRHKHDHRSAPSSHAQCQKRCQPVFFCFCGMAFRRYAGSGVRTGSCASRGARDGGAGRK
jgi:enterochelin esterase-like enzyme